MPEATYFNLLIVDDEPAILEGLEKTYDWQEFGFRVVGTARNGEAALALVHRLKPDVVMTDIRMKKMDGLELVRQCRQFSPMLDFVIISAHDNFEYAQQACSLGVFSYLLKPIEDAQIRKVMSDLRKRCENARRQTSRFDQYRRLCIERKQEIEQLLLKKYLTGSIGRPELSRQLNLIDSDLDDGRTYCAICFDTNVPDRILMDVDSDARRFVSTRTAVDRLSTRYPARSFELPDGRIVAVVPGSGDDRENDTRLAQMIGKIVRESGFGPTSRLITASGGFQQGFSGLLKSCEHALASFEYSMSVGSDSRTSPAERFPDSPAAEKYPHAEALQVIRSIRLNDCDLMDRRVRAFDSATTACGRMGRSLSFQRLCNDISYYLLENGGLADKLVEKLVRYTQHIFKLGNDEMAPVLKEILGDIITFRQERQLSWTAGRYDSRIGDVRLYVDLHLENEKLSINDAAEHVYLNVAYLGRLFKKMTGISFNEYIACRRVERASEFLTKTDMTVQEICERVGIPNSSYFSTVFRKHRGKSPSEYRRNE